MDDWKAVYRADMYRYGQSRIDPYIRIWTYLFRKTQSRKGLSKKIYHKLLLHFSAKRGIEIDYPVSIEPGLYIAHPYGITINDTCYIGSNCNIAKGVTIGQENRGSRKGSPVIGKNVWIGINSTIVGKIQIGDDVLIAPNTFLNTDVPSHSIVIGNPAKIIRKENATVGYINCTIEREK